MKILSCITDPIEIPYVIKAGADEVYFAVSWLPNYANSGSFKSFEQLKKAVRLCSKLKINFHLAVNDFRTPFFSQDIKSLKKTISNGVKSVIISDIGFGRYISDEFGDIEIHVSSLVNVMNLSTVEFIRKELGKNFKRLIFPNQLSASESESVFKWCCSKKIDTEVFFFRHFGCAYLNGYCYLHGDRYFDSDISSDGMMCRFGCGGFKADIKPCGIKKEKILSRIDRRLNCGEIPRILNASSFFDYYIMGVNFVKYGSRNDSIRIKIEKVSFIRKMLNLINELISRYPIDEAKEKFVLAVSKQ